MKKLIFIFFLFFTFTLNIEALEIKSKNYVLYNLDNNRIVLEHKKDEKVSVASLTKIVTTIVAIELIDDYNATVTMTEEMFHGLVEANAAVVGFKVGQKVTYDDLLK